MRKRPASRRRCGRSRSRRMSAVSARARRSTSSASSASWTPRSSEVSSASLTAPMPESSYDCIVIGSGPGGYVTAIRAAQLGMKTAVVEKDKVGGRCLNYACIPAKAVLRTADVLQEIRDADEYGLKVADPEVDYPAIMARREKVISTLVGGVGGLFKKNSIELIEGEAKLAGNGQVSVNGNTLQ